MSQWLYAGVTQAGFDGTILLETRHVKATLSAMTVKTDRKDKASVAARSFERGEDSGGNGVSTPVMNPAR